MSEHRVEDYPEIQGNFFLKSRDVGASRKLWGKIGVVTCYIKRGGRPWLESDKRAYDAAMVKAIDWLHSEARRWHVPLHIDRYYYEIDVPEDANPSETFNHVKGFLNSDTMEIAQEALEKRMEYDEMPFIFAYPERGRSFASSQWRDCNFYANENSTVFVHRDIDYGTIVHELLHQFGGQDFYFPERVKERATYYYKNSIMGVGNKEVDDLTAYLIGWKNTISNVTYWFLRDTNWITVEEYYKLLDEEWKRKWSW